jgi:hypothetical protein
MQLGRADARYGNRLVAGAKAMEIFGDIETEIAIRTGGEEGLCVAYHSAELTHFVERQDAFGVEPICRTLGVPVSTH